MSNAHLSRCHAVTSRHELIHDLERRPTEIRSWVTEGHLQRMLWGIYGRSGAERTPRSWVRAAQLRGGRGAVVVGKAALALNGIGAVPADGILVATPADRRGVQGRDIDPAQLRFVQCDVATVDRVEIDAIVTLNLIAALIDTAAFVAS